jgi:hypothetical protein
MIIDRGSYLPPFSFLLKNQTDNELLSTIGQLSFCYVLIADNKHPVFFEICLHVKLRGSIYLVFADVICIYEKAGPFIMILPFLNMGFFLLCLNFKRFS